MVRTVTRHVKVEGSNPAPARFFRVKKVLFAFLLSCNDFFRLF
jgi:hypothetical protein